MLTHPPPNFFITSLISFALLERLPFITHITQPALLTLSVLLCISSYLSQTIHVHTNPPYFSPAFFCPYLYLTLISIRTFLFLRADNYFCTFSLLLHFQFPPNTALQCLLITLYDYVLMGVYYLYVHIIVVTTLLQLFRRVICLSMDYDILCFTSLSTRGCARFVQSRIVYVQTNKQTNTLLYIYSMYIDYQTNHCILVKKACI